MDERISFATHKRSSDKLDSSSLIFHETVPQAREKTWLQRGLGVPGVPLRLAEDGHAGERRHPPGRQGPRGVLGARPPRTAHPGAARRAMNFEAGRGKTPHPTVSHSRAFGGPCSVLSTQLLPYLKLLTVRVRFFQPIFAIKQKMKKGKTWLKSARRDLENSVRVRISDL